MARIGGRIFRNLNPGADEDFGVLQIVPGIPLAECRFTTFDYVLERSSELRLMPPTNFASPRSQGCFDQDEAPANEPDAAAENARHDMEEMSDPRPYKYPLASTRGTKGYDTFSIF
jgi:hypothetical protein